MKPLVEGLVLKLDSGLHPQWSWEAPRGGAGIEISRVPPRNRSAWKPLVEGLVLKLCSIHGDRKSIYEAPRGGAGIEIHSGSPDGPSTREAPRGGAGIEIITCRPHATGIRKPLVEGLVLK